MKKLTAEKCCQLLDTLNSNGMSILEGYYAEALEIALPILEQQERGCQKCGGTGMADSGGTQPWGEQILIECDCKFEQRERGEGEWIEWVGGECPISRETEVSVKFRDGETSAENHPAGSYRWYHSAQSYLRGDDIIAYRIIPERAANQNGEQ